MGVTTAGNIKIITMMLHGFCNRMLNIAIKGTYPQVFGTFFGQG